MGESGCGKTTLINIIMGLEKADSGNIMGVPSRISAVFQEDCLCEDFSAVSNIRAVVGNRLSKSGIADALKQLDLTNEDISCPVHKLSGGMKRRVAIARAVLADGELIILDEPFKGLDNETRDRVAKFVAKETKNKTLILITHDCNEIELLSADSVIRMN
jgi:NitT/TauT family transport system ATP-binding protein